MKPIIVTLASAALLAAFAFIGSGYLHTRRAERSVADRRAAVHAMTMQQLAAAIARCDAAPPAAAPAAAYCETVARELDERPLEMVEVKPPAAGAASAPAPRTP